jgi:hypothetical protein
MSFFSFLFCYFFLLERSSLKHFLLNLCRRNADLRVAGCIGILFSQGLRFLQPLWRLVDLFYASEGSGRSRGD